MNRNSNPKKSFREKIYNTYVYIYSSVRRFYYNIENGIKGLIYWAPFAWKWRSWDFADGLDALEHHLKRLEKVVKCGYSANREATAKDIRVAIHVLKRIKEDRYYDDPLPECISKDYEVKHWIRREKEDWEFLFSHLKNKMKSWWD